MFVVVLFPSLTQSLRGHFCEAWACAMRDVINCLTVRIVLPKDDFDYKYESMIWNGNDSNYKVIFYGQTSSHLLMGFTVNVVDYDGLPLSARS